MAKILLAEDEVNIASFIERGLKEFGHSVTVCHDGNTGWRILQEEPFDLVILDIIMPKINGLELCHLYRQMFGYQAPVIMLTALGTTEDIVKGLDAGADDYLPKPFSVSELLARVRAILRRREQYQAEMFSYGDLFLNSASFELVWKDQKLPLSSLEYQIMEMLMRTPTAIVTSDTLMEQVWGWDREVSVNNI